MELLRLNKHETRRGLLPEKGAIKLDQFDFVRFIISDVNGLPRGRTVPRRNYEQFVEKGFGTFTGLIWMTQLSENCDGIVGGAEAGWPNVTVKPVLNTLHSLPWASSDEISVGEVLCEEVYTTDNTPVPECPRILAQRQLSLLEKAGYKLYSTFECELMVMKDQNNQMLWNRRSFCNALEFAKAEKFVFELDDLLSQSGINVESYQAEYEPGQLEMPIKPQYGITSADQAFMLVNAVKEICDQRQLKALFFTKPRADRICNAFHFNHSICHKDSLENAFKGTESGPKSVSEAFYKWMAGLIKHAPALCALSAPTVNCYRRYHQPWAPHSASWGFDNRYSSYRVKFSADSPPYIESRLPSSICNPYITLAATIAAGLDGNASECPNEMDPEAIELPRSLGEALDALEKDEVMKQVLGEDFIKNFIELKRTQEIEKLPLSDMSKNDQVAIDAELKCYGQYVVN